MDAGRTDAQRGAVAGRDLLFARLVDHAALGHAIEIGERDVVLDVLVEDESEHLAILGHIGEAGRDRVVDRIELDRAPLERRRAGDIAAIGAAEHAHRELRAPGAHEAGDAHDLAAPARSG